MTIKRERWYMRVLRRWAYRLVGIKYGPAMLAVQGEWMYIGHEGTVYRVQPTYRRESPLDISIERYGG